MRTNVKSDPALAASITRTASKQTYFTIRLLVDKDLVDDAFRAYAYFRWLDDRLDQDVLPQAECVALVRRQRALVDDGYRGKPMRYLTPEENLLIDLIRRDTEENSGLRTYIRNMMAVMEFDAHRRGRLVSQRELNDYTHWLAVAVTEAMHYFIGHNCSSPKDETRYLAVTGAHLTHMLRDVVDDARNGYYNIPREVLVNHGLAPQDLRSQACRDWVKETVDRARACFQTGQDYLARVESLRCRVAGYAYTHRFQMVLDAIEREGYLPRAEYPERKRIWRGVTMVGWSLSMALGHRSAADI